MSKALSKAAFAGLACLATVAAGTISPAASTALRQSAAAPDRPAVTRFAYNANAFGTKVVTNGVDARSLKDALINQPCTRRTGLSTTRDSILSTAALPEDVRDLVDISLSRSTTDTYRAPARGIHGVRAANTLATISLGGEVLGVQTPRLVIEGLKSVANSFHTSTANRGAGRFGFSNSFTFEGMTIELPEDSPVPLEPLQALLDALDPVLTPVEEVVTTVIATLAEFGTIAIPGLGSISLGATRGAASATGAHAEAYALKITLANEELGLTPTILQLGRAQSIISTGVPAGVFRSKMTALEANIGGVLRLGGIGQRSIPCEGTSGRVVTKRVASAGIPRVLDLSGIEYKFKGLQKGETARGFVQTTIGEVDLMVADIVLKGITSRVDLRSLAPNTRVTSKATTTIDSLLIGGKAVDLAQLAQGIAFEDAAGQPGFLRSNVLSAGSNGTKSFFGKQLTGLRITLPGTNTVIDLAVANGEVFFR